MQGQADMMRHQAQTQAEADARCWMPHRAGRAEAGPRTAISALLGGPTTAGAWRELASVRKGQRQGVLKQKQTGGMNRNGCGANN